MPLSHFAKDRALHNMLSKKWCNAIKCSSAGGKKCSWYIFSGATTFARREVMSIAYTGPGKTLGIPFYGENVGIEIV